MRNAPPKLLIALDCNTTIACKVFIDTLNLDVGYKIGSSLLASTTSTTLDALLRSIRSSGKTIFWDSKYFDIPSQVSSTIHAIKDRADMISVHILGGRQMLTEAVTAAKEHGTKIVGITRLTSNNALFTAFLDASLAYQCGIKHLVCPIEDVKKIKSYTPAVITISPGVRPAWYNSNDDHISFSSPSDAAEAGCDYVVVGRPILNSKWGYRNATKMVLEELSAPVAQLGRGTTFKQ